MRGKVPEALAFADDTTGALEVGAGFAQAGVDALVSIQPEPDLEAGAAALVVDTRSRRLAPAQAYEKVYRLGQAARRLGVNRLFKKTDSTLRGNVGAEFRALLDAWPEAVLLYVPAYPRLGRTVLGGALYVGGLKLGDTPFATDPLNPSSESFIPAVLKQAGISSVAVTSAFSIGERLRDLPAGSILVSDGVTDGDLEAAAAAVASADRPLIVAGTGGFAGWWIRAAGLPGAGVKSFPLVSRCLVVNGSLHPLSREQVRRAEEAGIPARRLGPHQEEDEEVAQLLESWLVSRRWCVLAAPEAEVGPPDAVTARLAGIVRRVLDRAIADGLAIFGGETALRILDAAGVKYIEPLGELLEGAPVSRFGCSGRSLALVTKAGGFGPPDVISAIKGRLERVE